MGDDIVRSFLRRVSRWVPADEVTQVELELRNEWGGAEVYVRKEPTQKKRVLIGQSVAAGRSINEAFADAGCGRRRGYMILSQRLRRA